jgi:hypothetical protein
MGEHSVKVLWRPPMKPTKEWRRHGRESTVGLNDQVAELATKIAGDGAPKWLSDGLSECIVDLKEFIAHTQRLRGEVPKRAELRMRLKKIAAASRLLESELEQQTLLPYLLQGEVMLGNEQEIAAWLKEISQRTDRAINDLPTKQGRASNAPSESTTSPAEFCAFIVAIAWKIARGRAIPVNGNEARAACEILWQMANAQIGSAAGRKDRWSANSDAMWRGHLRAVNRYPDDVTAKRIRRRFKRRSQRGSWYAGGAKTSDC